MTSKRALTYRLFAQALDLPPERRGTFLDEHCASEPDIRKDIEAMLGLAGAAGLETGALCATSAHEDLVGRMVGRFRLLERIGEGGMGVVYLAERTDGVQQQVAIKLVSSTLGASVQARFEREAQILARLEHPSVARLIDAGIEAGRAWLAMEFVRGERIDSYCAQRGLSRRDIVRLLVELAGAVAAAHGMLIVHSDIKPANVLVSADGQPKLIDFGISTALREVDGQSSATSNIGRLFSPNYAALEQVTGAGVTVATDVFGLGALAYRLLCGAPPYREAVTAVDYVLAVTRRDVELPSRAALAAGRPAAEARLLRGDLDAILLKALERDPSRRYASAAEFQSDLQRYLDGRPVRARKASLAYRAGKFARRNALAVGLTCLLLLSLIAGALMAWVQARSTAVAREMAARRGEFLESILKSADPRAGGNRDVTVAQLLDASASKTDALAATEPLVAASLLNLVAETNLDLDRNSQGLLANTKAIALLRAHGGSPAELASALATRGRLLMKSGRYRDAEAPLREAIALIEHQRGARRQLAAALNDLGAAYQDSEREAQAEAMYERSIEVYRTVGREGGSPASDPIANMGVLRYNQGRYAEAIRYMREAIAIRRSYLSADDPELLDAEYNYAASLQRDHQAPAAEAIYRDLLAAYTRIFGPDHADTLMAQEGLAANLLRQHRYAEASVAALPAAEGMSRAAGDSHDWTQTAWEVYGTATCLDGRGEAGLAALRRVATLRRTGADANSWRTQLTDVKIGICLVALGRYAEAEPMLLDSVRALEAARGATYDHTQAGYRALRDLYEATGRPTSAAEWQRKVLPGYD